VRTKRRSGTPSAASLISRPRDPLVLFLDESLDSDSIAEALTDAGVKVERLTHHLPRGTRDEEWLSLAGRKGWVVLTRDKRIRYRRLERLALESARVRAFVFTGLRGADALDRGKEVIVGSGKSCLGEHLPEGGRAQRLPVSRHRLAQDLDPVRDKEKTRLPGLAERAIVERRLEWKGSTSDKAREMSASQLDVRLGHHLFLMI
jgi:hypothetical protein